MRKYLNSLKLAVKLPAIIIALAASAELIVGGLAYLGARASLEQEAIHKLEAVIANRALMLTRWFEDQSKQVRLISTAPTIAEAMPLFTEAFAGVPASDVAELRRAVSGAPQSSDAIAAYKSVHNIFQPYFSSVVETLKAKDLLLITPDGRVIYSHAMHEDFGGNMKEGALIGSILAAAFDKALQSDTTATDIAAYAPSNGNPASFVAAPIKADSGEIVGVLAYQIPIEEISALLQDKAGLGRTGESIVVGSDFLFRSQAQFDNESSVLKRKGQSPPITGGLAGKNESIATTDYQNIPVIASFRPFDFGSTRWALITKQETSELFEPVVKMRDTLAFQMAVSLAIFVGLGMLVGRSISRPVTSIAGAMRRIAKSEFKTVVPGANRGDEIGEIAQILTQFRDGLAEAEHNNRIALYKSTPFDGSSNAMMITDREFKVLFANDALMHLFEAKRQVFAERWPGLDPSNLTGKFIDLCTGPDALSKAALSDISQMPIRTEMSIGQTKIALSVSPIIDRDKAHVGFVFDWTDVTETRLNAGILAAINRSQSIVEYSVDGRILNANGNFLTTLNFEFDELRGKPAANLVSKHEDMRAQHEDIWARIARGEHVAVKHSRCARHGAPEWFESSFNAILDSAGKPFKIVEIAARVTEQEHLRVSAENERQIRAQEQSVVVTELAGGLKALAVGDLTARIETPFAGEYEQLRTDFNNATERLDDTVKTIVINTRDIRREAQEIASAADDLARRTETQAATVERTAAALGEVTTTVRETAANAERANEVAGETRLNAESSGQTVQRAVEAMGAIETSAGKISQIIGVIDEIAFQTNLLALNAGVEAARAGDAGRGFAVVASEVRSLAQRSSDAAKEIKALIFDSSQHVSVGVTLVGEAGSALQGIVKRVGEVSTLVSSIATAASEQSSSIADINGSVAQIDQVVQQNAAMVEQSTAASHSMRGNAVALSELVARFKVSGGTEAREQHAANTPGRKRAAGGAR